MMIAAVGFYKFVDAFERGEAHSRADFGHLTVRANVNHVVVTAEAEIAHQAHLCGQGVVIGENGATLKSVKELCGMEAEDLATPKAANQFAFVGAAKGVGRIEQELQIAAASDGFERFDVAWTSPGVNADDSGSARSNHALDLSGIDVVGLAVDIAEDGRNFLPLERVSGSDKSERRNDHFACQAQRADSNFQRDCGVAYRQAIAHTKELRKTFLEILHVRTVVGQPVAVQHVGDALHKAVAIANIRTANVQLFSKGRWLAEDGQIVELSFGDVRQRCGSPSVLRH